uniref:Uncharacterized protein n=1 Tax=Avena sativa TaxID=4498 RepID=A0ACD5WZR8_AVESA
MEEACPAVCEICGSTQKQEVMAKCSQCNGSQHRYCLEVVAFEMSGGWCCSDCQKNANGYTKPIQGEIKGPMIDNNHRSMAHQIGVKTLQIYENSKVKFIPCEEAALLTKERPRKKFVARRTRSQIAVAAANKLQFMKTLCLKGAAIPKCPENTKQAVRQNDHLLRPKEEKGNIAARAKGNSWVDDQPRGENAFNTSDANIGCQSEPKNLHHNIDMPVVISSSVEYARRPPPEALCWTGCIVLSNGENPNFGDFKAYHPARVSPRVCNIAKNMPNNLQLKIFPRMKHWPMTFEQICPVYDDVALIFFSAELDCCEKKRRHLFETYCGFVMKAYIDDMMLLIYSSEVLPPDSQWIDGESYLWGVFVKPKAKSNPVT